MHCRPVRLREKAQVCGAVDFDFGLVGTAHT